MDYNRDFNPRFRYGDRVEEDVGETIDFIREPQPGPTWQGYDETIGPITTKTCLDGIFLLSNTMSIARIHGVFHFIPHPTVNKLTLGYFKGIKHFFPEGTKHIYEFRLGYVGSLVLSAIITTKEKVPNRIRPALFKMVQNYHIALREAILMLPDDSPTKRRVLQRSDKVMEVSEEDWERISENLPNALNEITNNPPPSADIAFPPDPKFFWAMRHLGQASHLNLGNGQTNQVLSVYRSSIKLTGEYALAVHISRDYSLPNQVMFWIPQKVINWTQFQPKDIYSVGIIPGLGNVTFELSEYYVKYATFYTKMFADAHKDGNKIFETNKLTKQIHEDFVNTTKGVTIPQKQTSFQKVVRNPELLKELLDGYISSCSGSTPARIELVYVDSSGITDIGHVITLAYCTCTGRINNLFDASIIQPLSANEIINRNRILINSFGQNCVDLSDKISKLSKEPNIYTIPIDLIVSEDEFIKSAVSELVLNVLLKGAPSRNFYKPLCRHIGIQTRTLNQRQHDLVNNQWPFLQLQQIPGSFKFQNYGNFRESVPQLKFPQPLQLVYRFLKAREHFVLNYAAEVRRGNIRVIENHCRDLVTETIGLILYHDLKSQTSQIADNITLSMLFHRHDIVRVSHADPIMFLDNLYIQTSGPNVQLAEMLKKLQSEVRKYNEFKNLVKVIISEKIKTEGYPLCMVTGTRAITVVHYSNGSYIHLLPSGALRAWQKGLLRTNSTRSSYHLNVTIKALVETAQNWMFSDERFGRMREPNIARIAAIVQHFYDTGKIYTNCDNNLRTVLQRTYDNLVNAPMPPPPPTSYTSSIDDVPYLERLNRRGSQNQIDRGEDIFTPDLLDDNETINVDHPNEQDCPEADGNVEEGDGLNELDDDERHLILRMMSPSSRQETRRIVQLPPDSEEFNVIPPCDYDRKNQPFCHNDSGFSQINVSGLSDFSENEVFAATNLVRNPLYVHKRIAQIQPNSQSSESSSVFSNTTNVSWQSAPVNQNTSGHSSSQARLSVPLLSSISHRNIRKRSIAVPMSPHELRSLQPDVNSITIAAPLLPKNVDIPKTPLSKSNLNKGLVKEDIQAHQRKQRFSKRDSGINSE